MKTEAELKSLAEFAAEFLKWKKYTEAQMGYDSYVGPDIFGEVLVHKLPETFFDDEMTAPILAHLGKREMEKRDWAWEGIKQSGKPQEYVWHFFKNDEEWSKTAFDQNEFVALWSAIEKAVGNEKESKI